MNQPGNGNAVAPSGSTIVRFETDGIFNPQAFTYYIIINAAGTGMPFYLANNSNFQNWTYAFVVGGSAGVTQKPQLRQAYLNPQTSSGVQFFPVSYSDAAYTFQPTVAVANVPGGFTFTFNRCILNIAPPTTSGATPVPSPSASASTTNCPPFSFPGLTNIWNINILTADIGGNPIDSLEPGGLNDTSKTFTIDVSQVQDVNYTKPAGSVGVSNPQAQVYGIEVLSTP